MATATATTLGGGGATACSTARADWHKQDVALWGNPEVRAFLESTLPGHPCSATFRHTTGRVLGSLSKDDLRRQVRDEEAANVIWAELRRLREQREEREVIEANGAHPFSVFVRTPADLSVELEVRPTDTIAELKERIAASEGTPVEAQRLTRNGAVLLDNRTMASYHVSHGTMLLLVPKLSVGGHRYVAPPSAARSGLHSTSAHPSGIPRPRVPVACSDIARPFPMSLEFEGIPEYQSFMLAVQRQAGRRDSSATESTEGAPFLEILPADNMREPVQTRITFDTEAEMLLIDTVGDMLMECTKYRVLLHLRAEQKHALLVTGIRAER